MVSAEGVAWFLIGEGSINITIHKMEGEQRCLIGYRALPHVIFTNTDLETLQLIRKWCSSNQIVSNLTCRKKRKRMRKDCYRLHIHSFCNVKKILELLMPYLVGRKKKAAEVMLNFVRECKRSRRGEVYPLREEISRFLIAAKYHDQLLKINDSDKFKYTYEFFVKYFKGKKWTQIEKRRRRYKCLKCGHRWVSLKENPFRCPKCLRRRFWLKPLRCALCGYAWYPRKNQKSPVCPSCGTVKWDHGYDGWKPWTREEIEYLRNNYKEKGDGEIASALKRTRNAVALKRRELKLKSNKRKWASNELKFLKENYSVMTDEEIAKILDRTRVAVKTTRQNMGLKKEF